MFYSNNLKTKSITYKKYNYASFANGANTDVDEKLLPVRFATSTYNYSYLNGALKDGLGIKEIEIHYSKSNPELFKRVPLPEGVIPISMHLFVRGGDKVFVTDGDMILIYASNKKIYAITPYTTSIAATEAQIMQFETPPMVANYTINGDPGVLIATEEEGLYWWRGPDVPKKITGVPAFTSMCMHHERLFVAGTKDNYKTIYFSDDLDPTNWSQSLSDGGFINLVDERGKINNIISFNDCLYLFREFGIDKMIAYGDQTEFQITPLFTSSTRIYPNTIKVCGDRIVFLATDGIYYFTGLSTIKYNLNIDSLFERSYNDTAQGAYYNGKYYLACKLNFEDSNIVGCESGEYKNNVLLELDIKSGDINILRGCNIQNINAYNTLSDSKLVVCIKEEDGAIRTGELSNNGAVFGVPTTKMWQSPLSSFGDNTNDKLLRSISLCSKTKLRLIVRSNKETKIYQLAGSNEVITIYPNLRAREFAIDFETNEVGCNISNPQVVVGYL